MQLELRVGGCRRWSGWPPWPIGGGCRRVGAGVSRGGSGAVGVDGSCGDCDEPAAPGDECRCGLRSQAQHRFRTTPVVVSLPLSCDRRLKPRGQLRRHVPYQRRPASILNQRSERPARWGSQPRKATRPTAERLLGTSRAVVWAGGGDADTRHHPAAPGRGIRHR